MNFESKNKSGFTLIEMLVAMAIFIIVIGVYMSIFVSTTKMHAKIIAIQKVQNEIRYVTETLSSNIRMGTINYNYYDEERTSNPKTTLALIDNAGSTIFYKAEGGTFKTSNDAFSWTNISYGNIYFNRMDFYITDDSQHPGVMFFIDAKYTNNQASLEKDIRFVLQNFVSSRQYK